VCSHNKRRGVGATGLDVSLSVFAMLADAH
jgi:hypothetical protein